MKIRKMLIMLLIASVVIGPAYAGQGDGKKKGKSLPPGLYKKLEKGKPLPPGWQKKLSRGDILDGAIYAQGTIVVPLGKDGTLSIKIEGTVFKLFAGSRKIIDILD